MESLIHKTRNLVAVGALSAVALTGCSVSIESYLNDTTNVQCDGKQTISKLTGAGMAIFTVHGKEDSDVATISIRKTATEASLSADKMLMGQQAQVQSDGFTKPVPIVNGPELNANVAGGAWIIDVRSDSVVIQGSCAGQ